MDEHLNSNNSPFKYNGKEFDEETGNYYYGVRYYDPKLSIFISVDPLAEKYPDFSSYAYVANNPIVLIDPEGKDIYRYDKESGNFILYKQTEDKTDMIGKFDYNKETGEYTLKTNNKGEAKTVVDGIAKGILKGGISFRDNYNVIDLGQGRDKPSEQDVKDFVVAYADNLANREVLGYALGDDRFSDKITAFLVELHKGNTWAESWSALRFSKNSVVSSLLQGDRDKSKGRLYTKYHYHTHPQYGNSPNDPSGFDNQRVREKI